MSIWVQENIWLLYIGLTVLLVSFSVLRWRDVDANAIALAVSVIVSASSVLMDYIEDGRRDPFFMYVVIIVWFYSLISGMATGWIIRFIVRSFNKAVPTDNEPQN